MKYLEKRWKNEWGGRIYFSHGTSQARGTMILIKKTARIKVHNICSDPEGRYIMLDVAHEKKSVHVS